MSAVIKENASQEHREIEVDLIESTGGLFEVRFCAPIYYINEESDSDKVCLPYSRVPLEKISGSAPNVNVTEFSDFLQGLETYNRYRNRGGAFVLLYQKMVYTIASGKFPQTAEVGSQINDLLRRF